MPERGDAAEAPPAEHVWALRTQLPMDEVNLLLPALEDAGMLGLTEEDGCTTAWFPARVDVADLAGAWERVRAGGWDESWREQLQPVDVGPFVITPPWRATGSDREIVIEPAQAFGTGHHETTTGCLLALCELDLQRRSVLDVGTGTGVLAIAAARRGARPVVACDTDPVAVQTAAENATANGARVTVVAGSVGDVTAAAGMPSRFDVVVANLSSAILTHIAPQLVEVTAGHLVVSGVGLEHVDGVAAVLQRCGMDPVVRSGREWAVLTGVRHGS